MIHLSTPVRKLAFFPVWFTTWQDLAFAQILKSMRIHLFNSVSFLAFYVAYGKDVTITSKLKT